VSSVDRYSASRPLPEVETTVHQPEDRPQDRHDDGYADLGGHAINGLAQAAHEPEIFAGLVNVIWAIDPEAKVAHFLADGLSDDAFDLGKLF
jgi:hypothetical protein